MPSAPSTNNQFSKALKLARSAAGRTQEDFAVVSSRTYVSSLERGMKSPTLQKVDELAHALDLHPLTLLTLAYTSASPEFSELVQARVRSELKSIHTHETEIAGKRRDQA